MKIPFVLVGAAAWSFSGLALARTDEFASSMISVMARMHAAMMVAPTSSADHDFAKMMIAHHQGAVEMAQIELRFGTDERLRRLAQGIIVEQRQEIAVMQGILDAGRALPPRNMPSSSSHPHPGAHP